VASLRNVTAEFFWRTSCQQLMWEGLRDQE
jgi:hypothetical protein